LSDSNKIVVNRQKLNARLTHSLEKKMFLTN
jgi:hypothetical protein